MTDHIPAEAIEAAALDAAIFAWHDCRAEGPGAQGIAMRAAIDAYNAKLREGMDDVRDRLRAALFAWWDSLEPHDEVVDDRLIDTIFLALSAQRQDRVLVTHPHDGHAEGETCLPCSRQDHAELIAVARTWDSAIAQAAPTTTAALIQELADALEGKSDE